MPKKLKIETDFNKNISLLAISCHKREFWLALQLNQLLYLDLRRKKDLPYYNPLIKEILQYIIFFYQDEQSGLTYFLTGNHNPEGKLFPEFRNTDYFLIINGLISDEFRQTLLKKIKSIKGVLTAFGIENNRIKDLDNFISDLELHMMDHT